MDQKNSINNYVILDTNIISRASDFSEDPEQVGSKIIDYLKDVISKSPEWGIAISSITKFELINMSDVNKELKRENALKGIKTFNVDDNILIGAGHLGCFYRDLGIDKDGKQITLGDKIIASTAVQTNSIIYTTNMRDYPGPFFKELTDLRKIITYEVKKCPVYLPTYFMQPDHKVIEEYWKLRIKPLVDKAKVSKNNQ